MARLVFNCIALLGPLALAACGGGGGSGVKSTPPPPSSPAPTPGGTNTTLSDLKYSQSFTASAATTETTLDSSTDTVASSEASGSPLKIDYDAASRSYTLTTNGRSQRFEASQIQSGASEGGEVRYVASNGDDSDRLTLATSVNRYVRRGYWQRGIGADDHSTVTSFIYGLPTSNAGVPRTGTARYAAESYGFVSAPGKPELIFKGTGNFDVDLALGAFSSFSAVTEYNPNTSEVRYGGALSLELSGRLGNGNGFTGNVAYSDNYGYFSGRLEGGFFGPSAEEVGMSFSASDGAGATMSGALTGRFVGASPINLSLVNPVADALYFSSQAMLSIAPSTNGRMAVNYRILIGQLTRFADGRVKFKPGESNFAFADFDSAPPPGDSSNYLTYYKVVNGVPTKLALFRPGPTNTELRLSYAGFGHWAGGAEKYYTPFDGRIYFTYGDYTPTHLLTHRTGSASYNGIARGIGADVTGTIFDVGGSSTFLVNFGSQRFSGSLQLTATNSATGVARDLGEWGFDDRMAFGQLVGTQLIPPGSAVGGLGEIQPLLYGPNGDEIAGSFVLQTGSQDLPDSIFIVGAAAAKQ